MTHPKNYIGTYKDNFGITDIAIQNDFNYLYLKIDGVEFKGSEFTALEIVDKKAYSSKQLERFTLYSTPIFGTDDFAEELCNCTFNITIPQLIIDLQTYKEFLADLKLEYIIGNESSAILGGGLEFEKILLTLTIVDKVFAATGDTFETILENIQNQFDEKYKFKNCFGCLYSDYSVYGQNAFGSMMCFVNQKDNYLKVKNKSEYIDNLTEDFDDVQEIFCCSKFDIRRKGAGYRG